MKKLLKYLGFTIDLSIYPKLIYFTVGCDPIETNEGYSYNISTHVYISNLKEYITEYKNKAKKEGN